MRPVIRSIVLLAATLLLCAGKAAALPNGSSEAGALLVLPVLTGSVQRPLFTYATVTNSGDAITLHINVISGDPGEQWQAQNFECNLTARETVFFLFTHSGAGSRVSFECNNITVQDMPLITENGVMVVTLEDFTDGTTRNDNQIFGDVVVVDFGIGGAFSAEAVVFQGGIPGQQGGADREYRFDGGEYTQFPSVVATNYVTSLAGSLVLFTLDGTVGSAQPPEAAVSIEFGGQGGTTNSTSHRFDCFTIVDMATIDGRFGGPGLGQASHLVLRPELVSYSNIAHDVQFDGGPGNILGVRRPPVHGWFFQTFTNAGGAPRGNFGRVLSQSNLPIEPSPGDQPVLNAR